ncbi:hypothetical protein ACFL3H_01170 [Gemmatimonadota bacterium]
MTLKKSALPAALAAMLMVTIGSGQAVAQTTFADPGGDADNRIDLTIIEVSHNDVYLIIDYGNILINWEKVGYSPFPGDPPPSEEYSECVIMINDIEVIIQDLDDSNNQVIQPSVGQMYGDHSVAVPLGMFGDVDDVNIIIGASYDEAVSGFYSIDFAPDNGSYPYSIQTGSSNEPPEIFSVAVSPEVIWPPNNRERFITLAVDANDPDEDTLEYFYSIEDEYGEYTCTDEPLTGGIRLMASRRGYDKDGRTYTITVTVVDPDGESDSMSTTVLVPHDKGKK